MSRKTQLGALAASLVPLAIGLAGCSSATAVTPPVTSSPVATTASTPVSTPVTSSAPAKPSPSAKPAASGYTMAQVEKHASRSSCWAAVDGKVYDLTSWIAKHPGGQARILAICGTDATRAFHAQHGSASEPNQILAKYKIGALAG